jgi:glycosyltransferase involved in cell wall biosynthesis
MKILIINDFCSRNGGAAAVAIDSALGLFKGGHEVRFVGIVGPIDPCFTGELRLNVHCKFDSTFLDHSNRKTAAIKGWWNVSAQLWFSSILKDWEQQDVIIHVHGWVKAFSPSVFSAIFNRPRWRVVITLHDYFIACPNGGFIDYPQTQICKRRALSIDCLRCNCDPRNYAQKLWRFGRGLIQTHVLDIASRVDGLVGVSRFSIKKLKPYLNPDIPIAIVRNPVSLDRPLRFGGNPEGPLLYVGRLSPEKGLYLALTAARRVKRNIIVIGEGVLKESLSRDYPEADFVGWAQPTAVNQAMKDASALVFPSLWYETNGLVVLEAMAHGLPVIVSDGCAATEFVEDGINGRHFKLGSIESLISVLTDVLSGQGEQLGRAAAEWYWTDPWSQSAHVTELERFYSQLLKTHKVIN